MDRLEEEMNVSEGRINRLEEKINIGEEQLNNLDDKMNDLRDANESIVHVDNATLIH